MKTQTLNVHDFSIKATPVNKVDHVSIDVITIWNNQTKTFARNLNEAGVEFEVEGKDITLEINNSLDQNERFIVKANGVINLTVKVFRNGI